MRDQRRNDEESVRDKDRVENYFKYDVEITMSGLGILLIEADEKKCPKEAKKITLFFPQKVADHRTAHPHHVPHLPLLTYYAEDNLAVPVGCPLYTSPEGREVVRQRLEKTHLVVEPDYFYKEPETTTLHWCDQSDPVPKDPVDDKYLDWLIDGCELGISEVKGGAAGTVVQFPHGELWARSVSRNRQSIKVEPILWRTKNNEQAVASEWVFRMQGLEGGLMLRLWDLDSRRCAPEQEVIELLPGGRKQECQETTEKKEQGEDEHSVLRLAITNQPERYAGQESHLPMLAELAGVDPDDIYIPTTVNDYHTINSACDVPYVVETGG